MWTWKLLQNKEDVIFACNKFASKHLERGAEGEGKGKVGKWNKKKKEEEKNEKKKREEISFVLTQ